jgi:hypothetical protein
MRVCESVATVLMGYSVYGEQQAAKVANGTTPPTGAWDWEECAVEMAGGPGRVISC